MIKALINDIAKQLTEGKLEFAIENPNDPRNFPRVFFNWRSNLLGDSGKGHEYFVKHLIGSTDSLLTDTQNSWQPEAVKISETPPEGKTDLFVSMDFRMTSSGFSPILFCRLPPGMKNMISAVPIYIHLSIHLMRLLVLHGIRGVIGMLLERLPKSFSELAKEHLPAGEDLVMSPLAHDTINQIAQAYGKVKDWRKGEVEAIPGKTMPNFNVVKRDYPHVYDMWITVGPNIKNGYGTKGVKIPGDKGLSRAA